MRSVRICAFVLAVFLGAGLSWAEQGLKTVPEGDLARHPPVVLVHGIWDTASAFDAMSSRLLRDGWRTFAISMTPNDGSASLEKLAEELRQFVDERVGSGGRFSLIGFSMGGLVARYYVQRLGGLDRLVHLIMISTPNHGTDVAYLQSLGGVKEMRPGSKFLLDLASDAGRLDAASVTTIWSPQDLMIEPSASSLLWFGKEVSIPFGWHSSMLRDKRVIAAVETALNGG